MDCPECGYGIVVPLLYEDKYECLNCGWSKRFTNEEYDKEEKEFFKILKEEYRKDVPKMRQMR